MISRYLKRVIHSNDFVLYADSGDAKLSRGTLASFPTHFTDAFWFQDLDTLVIFSECGTRRVANANTRPRYTLFARQRHTFLVLI